MTTTSRTNEQRGVGLASTVDRVVPGAGSTLDTVSDHLQGTLRRAFSGPVGRRMATALRGNEWLGHPVHPIVVTVPIGAWMTAAWFDLRGRRDRSDQRTADTVLLVGVVAAAPAALTGVIQFLDTSGQARRETAVHWALNNLAVALNIASLAVRSAGGRRWGRRLSAAALLVVGVSGFLGGDLTYRLRVGAMAGRDDSSAWRAAPVQR
jgi:uncharacterized membrane protein